MRHHPTPVGRTARTFILTVVVALVAAITLWPRHRSLSSDGAESFWCLGCGVLPLADFLLNIALFVPVGLALYAAGIRWSKAIAAGASISLVIELTQVVIPGRDPSVRDLIANAIGSALGTWAWLRRWAVLRPAPPQALRYGTLAAIACLIVLIGGSMLLEPSTPTGTYFGQWAPRFRQRAFFDGRLFNAALGGVVLPQGPELRPGQLQQELSNGEIRFEARLLPGSASWAFAPIAAVVDDQRREITALGQDGDDAVFRARTRAADLGLGTPAVRIRRALRGSGADAITSAGTGDTLTMRGTRESGAIALAVAEGGQVRDARLRLSPGLGWTVLQPGERAVGAVEARWISVLWVALLALPGAFWLGRLRRPLAIGAHGGLLALALVAVPALWGAGVAPWWELLGAGGGVLTGWRLSRR